MAGPQQGKTALIWGYLKTNKKWWLLPVIIFMLLLSVVIVFAGSSPLAPFIYTLF